MLVCRLRKWYSFHLTLSILFVIIDLNPKHFLFKKNNSVWPMCLCLICLVWNHLLCALPDQQKQAWEGGRIWRDHQTLHILVEVLFQMGEKKAYLTDRRSERLTLELMAEISQFSMVLKLNLRYVWARLWLSIQTDGSEHSVHFLA